MSHFAFLQREWRSITDFAAKERLPTMYPFRQFVDAGGLMSYGANLTDLFRRAAGHVDKILKGASPGLCLRADEIVE